MNNNLKPLLHLVQMVNEFERSKYLDTNRKIQRYRVALDELKAINSKTVGESTLPDKNWVNWVNWIAEERERLNQKLAKTLVEEEIQKKVLGLASGRADVLKTIVNGGSKSD